MQWPDSGLRKTKRISQDEIFPFQSSRLIHLNAAPRLPNMSGFRRIPLQTDTNLTYLNQGLPFLEYGYIQQLFSKTHDDNPPS